MFPPEVQLMFNAQEAIVAGQHNDPRFEQLVTKLMERCSMTKEQVIHNIIMISQGNIRV